MAKNCANISDIRNTSKEITTLVKYPSYIVNIWNETKILRNNLHNVRNTDNEIFLINISTILLKYKQLNG